MYEDLANDGSQFPRFPSIFQYWLKGSNSSPENAWIVGSKRKLFVLGDCTHPDWRGSYRASVDSENRDDEVTFHRFKEIIRTHNPRLVMLHFKGPDVAGHGNNWNEYLNEIRRSDSLMAECWKFLQSIPQYRDSTTLFMTNDHGRHSDNIKDGFISHGDKCEGCTHINFYATGPDFKSDVVFNMPRSLVDIAPTVGELMGFTMDEDAGIVMDELFK